MRIVVALGGNALLRRGEKPDAAIQIGHVRDAAVVLAPLAAEHELLICHGNGPQVGMLALESQTDPTLSRGYPLDDLIAQTQGMIGYWLVQSLANAGVTKPAVCLVSRTLVAQDDPAFADPTKFIGSGYPEAEARRLAALHSWRIAADGDRWRRVVASPEPVRLLEQKTVGSLLDAGYLVIAGGGGGAVVTETGGGLSGVEAVVDKDLLAALLAIEVRADLLLILTDVPAVMEHFGTSDATPIPFLTPEQVRGMTFPAGSMAPKMEGCARFALATGHRATIGSLSDAAGLMAGTAGTTVSLESMS